MVADAVGRGRAALQRPHGTVAFVRDYTAAMAMMDPGECRQCAWARVIESARGSQFWRCGRSDTDSRFRRYPPLPVRGCAGFEAGPDAADAPTDHGILSP